MIISLKGDWFLLEQRGAYLLFSDKELQYALDSDDLNRFLSRADYYKNKDDTQDFLEGLLKWVNPPRDIGAINKESVGWALKDGRTIKLRYTDGSSLYMKGFYRTCQVVFPKYGVVMPVTNYLEWLGMAPFNPKVDFEQAFLTKRTHLFERALQVNYFWVEGPELLMR